MPQFQPGALVCVRDRIWVVLPSDNEDLLLLRPLSGTDEEITGIYLPLEGKELQEAKFPEIDPKTTAGFADIVSTRLLWNAARLLLRDGAGPFRCLGKLSFRPRPYQFVPLMMALRLNPIRLFIADDVGIGKTIEAALIAREMLDRGEIKRLCVLCPPYLCEQWRKELWEKFHIPAVVIRSGTVARLEREVPPGESIFGYFPAIVVSIDYAKMERHRDNFLLHCPEFVIVDEVHGAAQPPGQNRAQQQRHELLKEVAKDPNRHLVLLTATPHSGVEESFRSLLALLDPEFGEYNLAELTQEQKDKLARHFIQRRRGDVRRWLGEETKFPERELLEVTYTLSPPYKQLFTEVFQFAQKLVRRGMEEKGWRQKLCYWNALAILRCVMSSPEAAERTLMAHGGRVVEESDETGYDPTIFDPTERETVVDTEPSHRIGELAQAAELLSESERRKLREFAKRVAALKHTNADTKLIKLVEVIRNLLREGFHPIVWCRYIATADYVAEGLRKHLPEDVTVYSVTGTLPEDERNRRVEELAKHRKRVLVATDCLSEGINLQEHFTAVVHYDLPWNPNRLEQRDGRVDRFGQPAEKVKSVLLYGRDNPVDGIVLRVLLNKAREIYRATGVSVPVPGDSESVTEAIVRALLLRYASLPTFEQLPLFEAELSEVRELHRRWDWVAQRERESRTRFAQGSLKPEEIEREIREMDSVLGDPDAVRRFVLDACQRLGVTVYRLNDDVWELHFERLPSVVRDRINLPPEQIPTNGSWRITFTSPPPEGAIYIGRNHPLVVALATHILESAIDNAPNAPARRCGAFFTDAVEKLTSIFILHLRFLLQEEGKQPMLAEEGLVIGAEGLSEVRWLETEQALNLLDTAKPTRNMSAEEQAEWVQEALNLWRERKADVQRIVDQRAKALQEAHRRVRKLLKEAPVTVKPHPPELLAVYVLVPGR
jgi:superfamily II DNA or RNA helicase